MKIGGLCAVMVVVVVVLVAAAQAGPSHNQWTVPCEGHFEAVEVICGGENPPVGDDDPREASAGQGAGALASSDTGAGAGAGAVQISAGRFRRSANATDNGADTLRRQKRYGSHDFQCYFDHPICSVGLKQKLCDGSCDGYYGYYDDTLYVDSPCHAVFTVVICSN